MFKCKKYNTQLSNYNFHISNLQCADRMFKIFIVLSRFTFEIGKEIRLCSTQYDGRTLSDYCAYLQAKHYLVAGDLVLCSRGHCRDDIREDKGRTDI